MKFNILACRYFYEKVHPELVELGFIFKRRDNPYTEYVCERDQGIYLDIDSLDDLRRLSENTDCDLVISFKDKVIQIYDGDIE